MKNGANYFLKPCPFCGGEAKIMNMGYPHWVYCESCGAKVHGRTYDEKDSVKAWNRREDEIDEEEAAERAVASLKKSGMIKRRQMTAIQKTEELLRLYPALKRAPAKPDTITAEVLENVEGALHDLEKDPYFDVITRFYFDGQSREFIAQARGASVTTITRNKARLLKELAPRLFSDDVIKDLLEA